MATARKAFSQEEIIPGRAIQAFLRDVIAGLPKFLQVLEKSCQSYPGIKEDGTFDYRVDNALAEIIRNKFGLEPAIGCVLDGRFVSFFQALDQIIGFAQEKQLSGSVHQGAVQFLKAGLCFRTKDLEELNPEAKESYIKCFESRIDGRNRTGGRDYVVSGFQNGLIRMDKISLPLDLEARFYGKIFSLFMTFDYYPGSLSVRH